MSTLSLHSVDLIRKAWTVLVLNLISILCIGWLLSYRTENPLQYWTLLAVLSIEGIFFFLSIVHIQWAYIYVRWLKTTDEFFETLDIVLKNILRSNQMLREELLELYDLELAQPGYESLNRAGAKGLSDIFRPHHFREATKKLDKIVKAFWSKKDQWYKEN